MRPPQRIPTAMRAGEGVWGVPWGHRGLQCWFFLSYIVFPYLKGLACELHCVGVPLDDHARRKEAIPRRADQRRGILSVCQRCHVLGAAGAVPPLELLYLSTVARKNCNRAVVRAEWPEETVVAGSKGQLGSRRVRALPGGSEAHSFAHTPSTWSFPASHAERGAQNVRDRGTRGARTK